MRTLTKVSIIMMLAITLGTIIPNEVHSFGMGKKICWHNGVSYSTISVAQYCSFEHNALPNDTNAHSGEHPDDCLLDETLNDGVFR